MREDWLNPPTLREATVAQREIAEACETRDRIGPVRLIAGADTSMKWRDSRGPIHAAVALQRWPERAPLPAATATRIPPFAYVPGYLGFREAPALLAAWESLPEKPDLLFVDGHGRAHPRRCGIATHLGVLLDVPAIGVAKSILCGRVEGDLGEEPGSAAPLVDRGEVVAMAIRTRARALPVYVGIGHRVSLETAVEWVLALSEGRRLPLPTRLAHDAANAARREYASI
ncbi:endonuclease V [Sphingomonas sp. CGMCC 1.13654]|uniref:Endonuclease V n=1 Tax=Sphingomonas chungangi TaxID=2683589 RepID=A0A838L0K0_9SPHN|nr:endonuclease V [Sphingomonas chungangi]MBA2932871.1 endonuclease V [Sphingomonas chungangi]MVW56491.1 endonuclease V [Sphingomonas chungangi]